jgi:hypothetical protein
MSNVVQGRLKPDEIDAAQKDADAWKPLPPEKMPPLPDAIKPPKPG